MADSQSNNSGLGFLWIFVIFELVNIGYYFVSGKTLITGDYSYIWWLILLVGGIVLAIIAFAYLAPYLNRIITRNRKPKIDESLPNNHNMQP